MLHRTDGLEQFPRLKAKMALFRFEPRSHMFYVLEDNVMSCNRFGNQLGSILTVAAASFNLGQS